MAVEHYSLGFLQKHAHYSLGFLQKYAHYSLGFLQNYCVIHLFLVPLQRFL